MSRAGILALSIATQATGALLNLVTLPLVASALGAEAFGIVGLCLTFQTLLLIVDGCNLMTRIAAEGQAGVDKHHDAGRTRAVFQASERLYGMFCAIVLLATGALVEAELPQHWLKIESMDAGTLTASVWLIALSGCAKLMASFYRGPIIGLSDMGYSNALALVCYLLRFPVAYAVVLLEPSVAVFLAVQLASILVEAAGLRQRYLWHHAPSGVGAGWSAGISALRAQSTLVSTTFLMAALLIVANQLDKIVLAGVLPLREYGAASLAIVICAGAFVAVTPILQVFLPSLLAAAGRGSLADSRPFFRMMTLLVALGLVLALVTAASAAPLVALIAPQATADAHTIRSAFVFYGAGNAVAIICQGIYWYHFAVGSLHAYRNMALAQLGLYFVLLLVLSKRFGLDGAGTAWLVGNLLLLGLLAQDLCRHRAQRHGLLVLFASMPLWLALGLGVVLFVGSQARIAWHSPLAVVAAVLGAALLLAAAFAAVALKWIEPRFSGATA